VFRSGEPLRLALRVAARTPRERAPVAVEVRDAGGRVLFRTETEATLRAGVARLTFDVPRLALLGGDYDLVVGDRVVPLSVAAEPAAEGVVDLRGTWRTAAEAEVAP
jgi:hypothetical protein